MTGNCHVRFLGEFELATAWTYPIAAPKEGQLSEIKNIVAQQNESIAVKPKVS